MITVKHSDTRCSKDQNSIKKKFSVKVQIHDAKRHKYRIETRDSEGIPKIYSIMKILFPEGIDFIGCME